MAEADYTLVIHGSGHIKTSKGDNSSVEELLESFIEELKGNGHAVELATITHGEQKVITE